MALGYRGEMCVRVYVCVCVCCISCLYAVIEVNILFTGQYIGRCPNIFKHARTHADTERERERERERDRQTENHTRRTFMTICYRVNTHI